MQYVKLTIYLLIYTFSVIWLTLFAIRYDVAKQLNRSYEIRDENKIELSQCYEQLGLHYESN